MKLILLVENNAQLNQFYKLNLQTWVGVKLVESQSAEDACQLMDQNPNISLVITKARIGKEQTAEIINKYISFNRPEISQIVIGASSLDASNATHLPTGLDIKPLVQTTAKLLDVTAKDMAELQVPQYYSIPISYFEFLKRTVTDVYIKDESGSFQLALTEYDDFAEGLIDSYIKNQTEYLFVNKQDRLKFVSNVTQELVAKIDLNDLDDNEQIQAAESNQSLLQQKLIRLGITEETVSLAQKNLKSVMNNVKKFPRLKKLMAKLLANKASYLFKHIQILTFIGTEIMGHIDWGNDEQKEKIAFIAFFHDIVLENDEQALIRSNQELKRANMDQSQKDLVNKHAQMAAELISKYPHAPMGVDTIIRQHHGINHGLGFSDTYGGNLSPMAVVFIIAEEFTGEILKSDNKLDIPAIITNLREKYTTQRFKKIIDAFEKVPL